MPQITLTPGAKLRAARLAAGLTQTELASRLGWNQSTVANLEADRKGMSLDRLDEVAQAIGCDPHSIDTRLSPLKLR